MEEEEVVEKKILNKKDTDSLKDVVEEEEDTEEVDILDLEVLMKKL